MRQKDSARSGSQQGDIARKVRDGLKGLRRLDRYDGACTLKNFVIQ